MRIAIIALALCFCLGSSAQDKLQYAGRQFFAISVENTSATSKWYETVFGMTLLKEIKTPDSRVHIRIIGNDYLQIEILQVKNSKSISDLNVKENQRFTVKGFFKTGFYVTDLTSAEAYFKSKKVTFAHESFEDKETHSKSFVIQDINGMMIQVLQDIK